MKELNLKRKVKFDSDTYGIPLTKKQSFFVRQNLENLKELSPSTSRLTLNFERDGGSYRGFLTIKSFEVSFFSSKRGSDPIATMLLLKDDIEAQLLEWKRTRFSQSLFKTISPGSNEKFQGKKLEGLA